MASCDYETGLASPLGTICHAPQHKFHHKPDTCYNNIILILTMLVQSRWAWYWPCPLFSEFMDLDSISVHNHAKKQPGQYATILTSHSVNNLIIYPIKSLTYRWIHLIVTGNVLMQSSQHNHGYHARQEQHNDQGIHDAKDKQSQNLCLTSYLK